MAKCKPGGKVLKFEPAGESFPYFDESRPLGSPPAGKVEEMRKYQKHNWIIQDGKNPPAVLLCNIRDFLKYITSQQQLLKELTFFHRRRIIDIFIFLEPTYVCNIFQEIYDADLI